MEEYKGYGFSDFLSDPDFRDWVKQGRESRHPVWPKLLTAFPEKAEDLLLATEILEDLFEERTGVSGEELEVEVSRILHATQRQRPVKRPVRQWWYGAAAALLGGIMLWLLLPEPNSAPVAYHTLKGQDPVVVSEEFNDTDSLRLLLLPDGSSAQLHPGARLTYLRGGFATEQESKREIYISGDVFFNVAKDPTRPFLVYTDDFITTVVGTSFLVRSSGERPSVEVRTGKVLVRALSSTDDWEIALTPNQKAVYTASGNKVVRELAAEPVVLPDHQEVTSFHFENTPIHTVFERLENAYGIPIHFDAEAFSACALSVRMGEELFAEKLAIICETIGAGFSVSDGEVSISGEGCR